MKKLIFCSHGRLCEGMLDTLKVFSLYDPNRMQALPFYTEGTDGEKALDQLADSITAQDQVIIFTDIAYGSVNQQVMMKFRDLNNVLIVTGMNLMLVLELAATEQPFDESLIEEKIQAARSSILSCKRSPALISDEDE